MKKHGKHIKNPGNPGLNPKILKKGVGPDLSGPTGRSLGADRGATSPDW
jgi:hypothetical protein